MAAVLTAGPEQDLPETHISPCPLDDEILESQLCRELERKLGPACGTDSEGFEYTSVAHMWEVESCRKSLKAKSTPAWYHDALSYWDQVPPTVDGVLGGFGMLSEEDVRGSTAFIEEVRLERPELDSTCAIDCGAGIGRVTKQLLLPLFKKVHLLEQSPPLIAQAPSYLGPDDASRVECLCYGMQAFEPVPQTYDLVWIQWVIGHLTDVDLVSFLKRCTRVRSRGLYVACVPVCTFMAVCMSYCFELGVPHTLLLINAPEVH